MHVRGSLAPTMTGHAKIEDSSGLTLGVHVSFSYQIPAEVISFIEFPTPGIDGDWTLR